MKGVLVPLRKHGAQNDPANYRPLFMLSHIREILEKAVKIELESVLSTERMQFGFQRNLYTLQVALDIAAVVEAELGQMLAVLDLPKAYDKVIRKFLVDKLLKQDIPENLVNQLIIFLLPLVVSTAGDLTEAIAVLTKGLVQGGTESPALFRFFIKDLADDLRAAVGGNIDHNGPSLVDPSKLVADDVILIGRSQDELQILLDVCSRWNALNALEWNPTKCTIVTERPDAIIQPMLLSGQPVAVRKTSKYLGIIVSMRGFKKQVYGDLRTKAMSSCYAVTP